MTKTKAKRKVVAKVASRSKPKPKPGKPKATKAKATKAKPAKPKATKAKPAKAKPTAVKAKPTKAKPAKAKPKGRSHAQQRDAHANRWLAFVEKHGVVLASAKGPVPTLAAEVAGEPIVGSWWSHPRAQAIFETLSAIDDDVDVRCFKLIDQKVTFVHRRVWPALVRLARDGVLTADRVASVQQEHMPTGEHRNIVTPFPDWVPDETAAAADRLTGAAARAQLGAWVG